MTQPIATKMYNALRDYGMPTDAMSIRGGMVEIVCTKSALGALTHVLDVHRARWQLLNNFDDGNMCTVQLCDRDQYRPLSNRFRDSHMPKGSGMPSGTPAPVETQPAPEEQRETRRVA